MVSSEGCSAVQHLEHLVVVREYQGSSYGYIPFSGGDPEGHYRKIDFSTGVFSAQDNRFNAYLRDQFAADVLALYNGETPLPSAEGQEDLQCGHSANKRQDVNGRVVEVTYWSNAQRAACLPNERMYALTVRMETMPEQAPELQERVSAYLTQLQQTFGLLSTNNSATHREAA